MKKAIIIALLLIAAIAFGAYDSRSRYSPSSPAVGIDWSTYGLTLTYPPDGDTLKFFSNGSDWTARTSDGSIMFESSETHENRTDHVLESYATARTIKQLGGEDADEELNNAYEAVKFTTGTSPLIMGSVKVRLKVTAATARNKAGIVCYLYSDDGGSPSKPNARVATSGTPWNFAGQSASSYQYVRFYFSTAQTLTANTSYWIVFREYPTTLAANGVVYTDTATATALHAYSANGSAWTTENNKRMGILVESATPSAVYGYALSDRAIYGYSDAYIGVHGWSTMDNGVRGDSKHGTGVWGESTNWYGVKGVSDYGVAGYFTRDVSTADESTYGAADANTPVVHIVQADSGDVGSILRLQGDDGDKLDFSSDGSNWLTTVSDGYIGFTSSESMGTSTVASFFPDCVSGETPAVGISGYKSSDQLRTMTMGFDTDTANRFTFSGVSVFNFDGTVKGTTATGTTASSSLYAYSSGTGTSLYSYSTSGLSIDARNSSTSTNTVIPIMTLGRLVSAAAGANGEGSSIDWYLENSNDDDELASQIATLWTNATDGAEASAITWSTRTGGAAVAEKLRLEGDGTFHLGANNTYTGTAVNSFILADGNEPITVTNGSGIVSKSGELYAFDAGGNDALLTNDREDEFYDPNYGKYIPTANIKSNRFLGIEQRIDLYKLAKLVEGLTGEKIITTTEIPTADWDVEQAKIIAEKQAEINKLTAVVAALEARIADANEVEAAELTKQKDGIVIPTMPKVRAKPQWIVDAEKE